MHVVPGDHSTMFREPHVAVLAEKIKTYLDIDRRAPVDRPVAQLQETTA
jgi:hypothetical protein